MGAGPRGRSGSWAGRALANGLFLRVRLHSCSPETGAGMEVSRRASCLTQLCMRHPRQLPWRRRATSVQGGFGPACLSAY